MNSRFLGGLCAIAAFGLDQGTKALALNTPALERGVEVLPFLNLVRVLNDGVSFGMLGGIVPWWGLIALAAVIVAWLLIWLWRAPDRLTAAALGLIIGGALGNVLDRLRYRAVPDFLDFPIRNHQFTPITAKGFFARYGSQISRCKQHRIQRIFIITDFIINCLQTFL